MPQATPPASLLSALCRQITRLRRLIVNLLFVLLLILVFFALIASCQPRKTPTSRTLLLNPTGVLIEHAPAPSRWEALLPKSLPGATTAITDLLDALTIAAADTNIDAAVLDLNNLSGIRQGQAERLGRALDAFRSSGKAVSVYSYGLDQNSYLLASYSDAIYLHPMGQAMFAGVGLYSLFIKDLLETLKIDVEIFRAGEQKSATETFTRQDLSPTVKADYQQLSNRLWQRWLSAAADNRALPTEQVRGYAEAYPRALAAVGGDMARAALEAELVDELLSPDEFIGRLNDAAGHPTGDAFKGYDFRRYLANKRSRAVARGRYLGVVILEGNIVMNAPQGAAIGARQTVALLQKLRRDSNVAGLLVRINSAGGSSFASELIRKELELFQLSDRPLYASFADTAASGGYWIAATADQIFAEPTTVTGSIGVFSIVPSFPRALRELGVTSDGVGTTALTGGLSPVRGLNAEVRSVLNQTVQYIYQRFTTLVARGRELPLDAVESVADGRIMLGAQAQTLGLVDELGSLEDAEARLLEALGLEADATRRLVPQAKDPLDQLQKLLFKRLAGVPEEAMVTGRAVLAPLALLKGLDDPNATYALCSLCVALVQPAN